MKQRTRLLHSGDDLISNNMHKHVDSDGSEIQLHKMKPHEHYIEAQVQEGDTLQAIALRFYCSISELKRINQIHKDNEIFARRTVKVPVTPYSVLTEMIPPQPAEPVPSTSSHNPTTSAIQDLLYSQIHKNLETNDLKINEARGDAEYSIDCNAVVLNSTIAPAVIPYTDIEPIEPISEDTKLLPNRLREPVETVVVKELTSHGADFGLKWFHLVCCMLVLGVVLPLIYVMFYLDKHEHSDIPPLHTNR